MSINKNCSTSVTRLSLKLGWCVIVGATGLLLTTPALARAESTRFDIAAQPLSAALRAFAGQAHMQLLYEQGAVAGANGNAVIGELDKQTALVQLLRNTGLEIVYSSESAVTIRPADKQVQQKTEVDEPDRLRVAQVSRPSSGHDLSRDSERLSLEEVIVTARRREENVQTVPISITVLSQQALQNNNVSTIEDLQHHVPSLSGNPVLSRDAFSVAIRGQTQSNFRPGVFMYLNEVPVPQDIDAGAGLAGGPGLLFDLENVQVLKGPQGTLFGRNSVGGSVLLQSARPKKEFGGRIQLGYGNYNSREVDAAINVPIIDDTLLTRIAFNGGKRNGFTWLQSSPNHPNGIDTDNRDYWSVRGSVTFRPSGWFENDTTATYQHYQSNGSPLFQIAVNPVQTSIRAGQFPNAGFANIPALFAQQQALGIRTHIPVDTPIESKGTLFAISNVTSIELADDLKFRTILGFDRAVSGRVFDIDGMPIPINNQPRTLRTAPVRQLTAETQLLGKSFGGRLEWIAGAFFLKTPLEDYVLQTGTQFGFVNDSKSRSSSTSKALFTQGTYDLSALADGLKVTGGVRYTWDRGDSSSIYGGFGTDCTSVPTVKCDEATATKIHTESSALTWTTGLDYQAAPNTLIYFASRRGYRAGGGNGNATPPTPAKYDPEYVLDYELGVKSDWKIAGRPLRTNAAIYYQNYTDAQVTRTLFQANTIYSFTDNAADARLWGGELEALLSLTNALELGVNASYLNYRFTKIDVGDPNTTDPNARRIIQNTITDLRTREKNSPSTKYGLSARYRLPLEERIGDVSMQANWNWQAAAKLGGSLGITDIPAYGLLNLAINWDHIVGGPMDASFFMSNVTDKEYLVGATSLYTALGYNDGLYGEPRMYGLRLRYRFGAE